MVGRGGHSGEFNSSRDIYVADNVYSLLGTRTGYVVNLLMGQDAIIDDPAGRRLRSVELDVQRLRCCRSRDGLGEGAGADSAADGPGQAGVGRSSGSARCQC